MGSLPLYLLRKQGIYSISHIVVGSIKNSAWFRILISGDSSVKSNIYFSTKIMRYFFYKELGILSTIQCVCHPAKCYQDMLNNFFIEHLIDIKRFHMDRMRHLKSP